MCSLLLNLGNLALLLYSQNPLIHTLLYYRKLQNLGMTIYLMYEIYRGCQKATHFPVLDLLGNGSRSYLRPGKFRNIDEHFVDYKSESGQEQSASNGHCEVIGQI